MSTKQSPGPFSGLAKAAPDEPIFTLRAHDPLGAILAHEWVWRRRKEINRAYYADEINEKKYHLELIQCREAEELAWRMEAWRERELGQQAEAVETGRPAPYSGHSVTEEELAARAQFETIQRAGTMLQNAIGEINEASEEVLAPLGSRMHSARAVLCACRDRIKAVAEHIAPKRTSYYPGQPLPEEFTWLAGQILGDEIVKRIDVMGEE